jgi:hypothetical protein
MGWMAWEERGHAAHFSQTILAYRRIGPVTKAFDILEPSELLRDYGQASLSRAVLKRERGTRSGGRVPSAGPVSGCAPRIGGKAGAVGRARAEVGSPRTERYFCL